MKRPLAMVALLYVVGVLLGLVFSPLPLAMVAFGLGLAFLPIAVVAGAVTVTVLTGSVVLGAFYLVFDAAPMVMSGDMPASRNGSSAATACDSRAMVAGGWAT